MAESLPNSATDLQSVDQNLKDRIMQAIRAKPQTSEELAAQLGTSDRTIRRRLEVLPVIAKTENGRKLYSPASPDVRPAPCNSGPETINIHAATEPESPAHPVKRSVEQDTPQDTNQTLKKEKIGLSDSVCILAVLKSEPDYTFTVRDVVLRTNIKTPTANRILNRLSSSGKGAGPVNHVGHGLYRYAPEKQRESFTEFIRSANLKVENLVFTKSVRMEAHSIPVSDVREPETLQNRTPADPRIPTAREGYPVTLPTGHQVSWEQYENGNQLIRISANGAPPMSPDTAILLIDRLGLDDTWKCVSLELNVDSYKHRIDASYSVQTIEGLLLKAYQHGYNTRVEIADRRKVSIREVLDLFHSIAGGIDGKEALKEVASLKKEIKATRQEAGLALNIARQVRDREPQSRSTRQAPKKQKNPAPFTTASALMQEQSPAAGAQEPVT